jgi:NAD(P)-dependent dehydrogenase (short-subunit alcohol dehydrogenase family)
MLIDRSVAAVVTGGASGLGKATAQALAKAGVRVAIFDINADAGEGVAKEIGGVFCKVDILSEESVVAGFAKARGAHGQERICVHCAMTARRGKTLAFDKATGGYKRTSTEDYAFGVEGILVASYRIASLSALGMASLPPLEDGERGVITLTASVAAQDAQIGQVIYGSAKAGVNGLVLPMARDLMDLGIRVNSIMPAAARTRQSRGVGSLSETVGQTGRVRQPRAGARQQHLLQRTVPPPRWRHPHGAALTHKRGKE